MTTQYEQPTSGPAGTPPGAVLSPAQERLWLLDQLGRSDATYMVSRTFWLDGPLQPALLERAVHLVAERHDVLRCRIVTRSGRPEMASLPAASMALERVDVAGTPDAEHRALRLAVEQWSRPCDLSTGPLLRGLLVRVAEDRHLFNYNVHHIVFDGPSRVIFERELSEAYRRLVTGDPTVPERLPMRYADAARARHAEADSGALANQLAYWRDRLSGAPALMEGLTDWPRPVEPLADVVQQPVSIGRAVTERMRRLAMSERTSLFVVALAAYQYVLGRTAGCTDVVVGVPMSGRMDPDLEPLIGFFTATVAIRTDLAGQPTLRMLVRQVRDRVLEALDHQDVPFDRVVRALDLPTDPTVNPLFQHWFGLVDGELANTVPDLPGICCRLVEPTAPTMRFDTEVDLRASEGTVQGYLRYAAELFEPTAMEGLAGRFGRILDLGTMAPDAPVDGLPLVSSEERAQLLALAASGRAADVEGPVLNELFLDRCARTPDAVAVSDGVTTLTFAELAVAANAVAHRLAQARVGPGDVVALHLPRNAIFMVGMVGAVLAGAGYLPLDVTSPPDRLAYQLRDAGAAAVLVDADTLMSGTPSTSPTVDRPVVSAGPPYPALPYPGARTVAVTTDDLLYVIYTSGSTGAPKGLAISHRQCGHLVRWHLATYPLTERDRVAQTANVSFDAAVWEMWPALLAGARLDICPDHVVTAPDVMVRWLAERGTTVMFAATPLAEQLLRHPLGLRTSLRFLLTGGDVFRPSAEDDPGIDVYNHYGPTENTVVATATTAVRAPWDDNSIGRPIGATRVYLLDELGRLVPRGAVGEIALGGPAVSWGYRGRSALTADRFVPDPFSQVPAARLFRTGDLASWRVDGNLRYLGRRDGQLKVRGYRIEAGEVEAALLSCSGVGAAAVAAVTGASGTQSLVAYLVPATPGAPLPKAEDLRSALSRFLPYYMRPHVFVELAELPMTASGKVDRRRLPAPEQQADVTPYLAPRTEVERMICRAGAEVLGVERVGVRDDFFALGGSSMTAARLLARLNQAFDTQFPLRGVFDHPVLADLARAMEEHVVAEIAAMSPEQIDAVLRGE
ncbi:non-ribosomal peptide synthetase [Micromonospora sp. DT4]|uniref:non-ribosomal peptide synthetase n=1 Tax=Micromonospora sp. DT4 TaxID=3393438 RepID=UPI003CFB2843